MDLKRIDAAVNTAVDGQALVEALQDQKAIAQVGTISANPTSRSARRLPMRWRRSARKA
jgi:hypothetical protein